MEKKRVCVLYHMIKDYFLFFVLKNRKHGVYRKYFLIIFIYFLKAILINNDMMIIKNKILKLKIIFKILKIF